MLIDGIIHCEKTTCKYLGYLLDRISLESNNSEFKDINLRYPKLLVQYGISPSKQFYKGFLTFLAKHRIVECTTYGYVKNCLARRFDINFERLYDVIYQYYSQASNYLLSDLDFFVRFKYKENIPSYFRQLLLAVENDTEVVRHLDSIEQQ